MKAAEEASVPAPDSQTTSPGEQPSFAHAPSPVLPAGTPRSDACPPDSGAPRPPHALAPARTRSPSRSPSRSPARSPARSPVRSPEAVASIAKWSTRLPINSTPFIQKLYTMLEEPKLKHVINWGAGNDSFLLNPNEEFSQALCMYFKHTNVSSFVRQLSMYGFYKVTQATGPARPRSSQLPWEFRHLDGTFRRGDFDALRNIKRRSRQIRDRQRSNYQRQPLPGTPAAAVAAVAGTAPPTGVVPVAAQPDALHAGVSPSSNRTDLLGLPLNVAPQSDHISVPSPGEPLGLRQGPMSRLTYTPALPYNCHSQAIAQLLQKQQHIQHQIGALHQSLDQLNNSAAEIYCMISVLLQPAASNLTPQVSPVEVQQFSSVPEVKREGEWPVQSSSSPRCPLRSLLN